MYYVLLITQKMNYTQIYKKFTWFNIYLICCLIHISSGKSKVHAAYSCFVHINSHTRTYITTIFVLLSEIHKHKKIEVRSHWHLPHLSSPHGFEDNENNYTKPLMDGYLTETCPCSVCHWFHLW